MGCKSWVAMNGIHVFKMPIPTVIFSSTGEPDLTRSRFSPKLDRDLRSLLPAQSQANPVEYLIIPFPPGLSYPICLPKPSLSFFCFLLFAPLLQLSIMSPFLNHATFFLPHSMYNSLSFSQALTALPFLITSTKIIAHH